jgi:hypothetical protein
MKDARFFRTHAHGKRESWNLRWTVLLQPGCCSARRGAACELPVQACVCAGRCIQYVCCGCRVRAFMHGSPNCLNSGPQPERLHLEAEYMAAPERFAKRSDSFPLHRGRRPYMARSEGTAMSAITPLSGDKQKPPHRLTIAIDPLRISDRFGLPAR